MAIEGEKKSGPKQDGFEVEKFGHARVAMIGKTQNILNIRVP
jgi:ribosome-interacting GTPase 1